MPNSKNNKTKSMLRVIILTIIGIVAFVVSVMMNIIGMHNAIIKAPDSSGMASISVRTKANEENKKTVKVNDDGKIVEEDFLVNAVPIINLINNNWDRVSARFSGFQLDENGNAAFEEGYTLYCNVKYVNYVEFNENFKKEVIGHLKVGDDFKTVKEKLGEPTFKKDNCIGYKSREIYAFFYDDKIVIYPNRKISNESLEELLTNYIEKTYTQGRTRFLVEIRNNYPDFIITQDDKNNVILTSTTRQIVIKIDNLENLDAELYNGYKIATETSKKYLKENRYVQYDEDLVDLMEDERVSGK